MTWVKIDENWIKTCQDVTLSDVNCPSHNEMHITTMYINKGLS